MTEELKPCPFCGAPAFVERIRNMHWQAKCSTGCDVQMHAPAKKHAIAAWNTRAQPEAAPVEPVAWIFSHKTDSEVFMTLNKAHMDPRYWTETPLYAHPPAAPTDALVEALREMFEVVCGETGFAQAVRAESGFAYPWPALDLAEAKARAALAAMQEVKQ